VVHLPLNVTTDAGESLKEEYQVGTTYPVYILTDKSGDIITRWTGYTGGAAMFVKTLNQKLKDLTTIKTRKNRFEKSPNFTDAVYLARYNTDIYENLKAIEYYRQAEKLKTIAGYDFSFDIFKNSANAAWTDKIPFDSVLPAADAVINAPKKNINNIIKVGEMMIRLGRKLGMADRIGKYLLAGLNITAGDSRYKEKHENFRADSALYIKKDTALCLEIKKASMGDNWIDERDRFYMFSKWCLEREINLEEAEIHARRAIDLVYPGKYRARVLNTVAEICYARGDGEEAVKIISLAIEQQPENEFYQVQLEKFISKDPQSK